MIDSATQSRSFGFGNPLQEGRKGLSLPLSATARDGRTVGRKDAALSSDQQHQVDQLKATDRKVRAHEQAHMAAGGDLVLSGAAYSYETGPDKQRYAVAGEVSIDTSKAREPEETIQKAGHIRQAALAPADPSPQDRRVAAYASQLEMQARQELAQKAAEERSRTASERSSEAIGAYQVAGGLETTAGFSARA